MPVPQEEYFASFTPACFALLTEACLLSLKINRCAGINHGFFWAAVRAIERREAECIVLSGISSSMIEESFESILRKLPGHVGLPSLRRMEEHHADNPPIFCPPSRPPRWGNRIDPSKTVGVGQVLADIFAKFNFAHAVNYPLFKAHVDVEALVTNLEANAYLEGDNLTSRGRVSEERIAVYRRACELAKATCDWSLRDIHVAAAASEEKEEGIPKQLVTEYEHHVEGRQIFESFRISGPLPWMPSACPFLGLPSPPGN